MARLLHRVLLTLLCCALCAGLVAACGGEDTGDAGAQELLKQTFTASTSAIDNGQLNASFRLDPEGLLALGGPLTLKASGPFAAPQRGDLPRFDLAIAATLAGQPFRARALSTGTKGYLELDGRPYKIDDAFVSSVRDGLGGAAAKPKAGLTALGIDPTRWIKDPQEKGNEQVAGVDTVRIGGDVNVEPLLADIDALLSKAGGASSGGDLLTPELRKQLAAAVESATVDIWTGAGDKILRQIAVRLKFAFKDGATSPITGLDAGVIDLRIRLDDVNKTALDVTAPKAARPLSRLTGGGLSNFLAGIGASLTGGAASGLGPTALLKCITQANGKTASLVRCASKLAK